MHGLNQHGMRIGMKVSHVTDSNWARTDMNTIIYQHSLQSISSLPSKQLEKPLHRKIDEMHCPFEHLNWLDVQSAHSICTKCNRHAAIPNIINKMNGTLILKPKYKQFILQ